MNTLLSVLVYRKSSQAFIDQYRSLFEPYLESGRIAFCFWDEHGEDISSSLPELEEIVRGVNSWNAIVVLPLEENEDLETRQDNPFDYTCNQAAEPLVEESKVPLIRLAQMLGGVPPVSTHYVSKLVDITPQRRKNETELEYLRRKRSLPAQQVILSQEEDASLVESQQSAWEALNEKYSFKCTQPNMLYLLKARAHKTSRDMDQKNGEQERFFETDSSLFWYRNRYPAKTRFLTQDCIRMGYARYQEDLFRFWMTAFTLALNDFPSGVFEAYKVYETCAKVDQDQLHQVFSNYYFRLSGARDAAEKQIAELKKGSVMNREQEELPLQTIEVPVQLLSASGNRLLIPDGRIGFSGDCPVPEEPWWLEQTRNSRWEMDKLTHSTQRELDHSCSMCRTMSGIRENEVRDLDEYQYEEMTEKLSEMEKEILVFHTNAILPFKLYRRAMYRREKSALTSMRKRMSRKRTVAAGAFGLLIYFTGFLPDLVHQWFEGFAFTEMLGITLLGCGLMGLAAMGALVHFRRVIRKKIRDFNRVIFMLLNDYQEASSVFSAYLSKCCSYMRGISILQALKNRTKLSAASILSLSNHVDHLERQMNVISGWLEGFHLKVLPDSGTIRYGDFDFDIPPEKNREYLFQWDQFQLKLNLEDGSVRIAPYPFVTDLNVKRLRLYEKQQERGEKQP